MADNRFELEIIVPEKVYCKKMVNSVSLMTADGRMTILSHHTDMIANVPISHMSINENGHSLEYAVAGGLLNIYHKENKVLLVLNAVESKDEIDLNRATLAKEKAENRLNGEKLSVREQKKAEIKLKRALNRISLLQK